MDQGIPGGELVIIVHTDEPELDASFDFDVLGTMRSIAANDSLRLPVLVDTTGTVFPPIAMVDPSLGWELVGVTCDDPASPRPSIGDVATRTVTFAIEPDETVTCEFVLRGTEGPEPTLAPEPSQAPARTETPSDAGRVLPLAGSWSVTNTASTMECGRRTRDLATAGSESVTLDVRRNGDRLVGKGSGEWRRGRLTLKAVAEDRYEAKQKAKVRGKDTTVSHAWQVVSPEHMVATATAKVRSKGTRCTGTREFEVTYEEAG